MKILKVFSLIMAICFSIATSATAQKSGDATASLSANNTGSPSVVLHKDNAAVGNKSAAQKYSPAPVVTKVKKHKKPVSDKKLRSGNELKSAANAGNHHGQDTKVAKSARNKSGNTTVKPDHIGKKHHKKDKTKQKGQSKKAKPTEKE